MWRIPWIRRARLRDHVRPRGARARQRGYLPDHRTPHCMVSEGRTVVYPAASERSGLCRALSVAGLDRNAFDAIRADRYKSAWAGAALRGVDGLASPASAACRAGSRQAARRGPAPGLVGQVDWSADHRCSTVGEAPVDSAAPRCRRRDRCLRPGAVTAAVLGRVRHPGFPPRSRDRSRPRPAAELGPPGPTAGRQLITPPKARTTKATMDLPRRPRAGPSGCTRGG